MTNPLIFSPEQYPSQWWALRLLQEPTPTKRMILEAIESGHGRYSELAAACGHTYRNNVTNALEKLRDAWLVEKRIFREDGVRQSRYDLSAFGREVLSDLWYLEEFILAQEANKRLGHDWEKLAKRFAMLNLAWRRDEPVDEREKAAQSWSSQRSTVHLSPRNQFIEVERTESAEAALHGSDVLYIAKGTKLFWIPGDERPDQVVGAPDSELKTNATTASGLVTRAARVSRGPYRHEDAGAKPGPKTKTKHQGVDS